MQNGRVYVSTLLRRSFRDGQGRVQKQTLANLSALPDGAIEVLRAWLAGGAAPPVAGGAIEILSSRHHGAVAAVQAAFEQLGFVQMVSSTRSRQRDLVCAMVAARILRPHSKLATTRWWKTVTIGAEFGVEDAGVDELYEAMDWLLARQRRIEGKLAKRHLADGDRALWDLSSTWLEGRCCPLARRGYSRDGKRGKLQIAFGLLCCARGRPVSISVWPGNVMDHATVMAQLRRLRTQFRLETVIVVGDRGMFIKATLAALSAMEGIEWITALRSAPIRKLLRSGTLAPLDGDVTLCEIHHPDFPGERLVACRNPALARRRGRVREDLLAATEAELAPLRERVAAGNLAGAGEIGVQAGLVINRYKVRKHFDITITDDSLDIRRRQDRIREEAALDGIYVIRTSLPAAAMTAGDCVRGYKSLARVERAFRAMKTTSLELRPIHHRLPNRVRAHVFLCMLAWYVEWHMRAAWAPLLFADPDLEQIVQDRDPVEPARPSATVRRKTGARGQTDDGGAVHSFRTMLADLATITRNRCRISGAEHDAVLEVTTTADPGQKRALDLLKSITTI